MDDFSLLNTVNQFIKKNKSPSKKHESPAARRNFRSYGGSPEALDEEPSIVGTPKLYKRQTNSHDGRQPRECSIPDINNSGSSRRNKHVENLISNGFTEI